MCKIPSLGAAKRSTFKPASGSQFTPQLIVILLVVDSSQQQRPMSDQRLDAMLQERHAASQEHCWRHFLNAACWYFSSKSTRHSPKKDTFDIVHQKWGISGTPVLGDLLGTVSEVCWDTAVSHYPCASAAGAFINIFIRKQFINDIFT